MNFARYWVGTLSFCVTLIHYSIFLFKLVVLVFVRTYHFRSVLPTMQPSPRLESPFSHISHRIKELIGSESRDFKSETMRCGKFLKFKNLEHFLVSGNHVFFCFSKIYWFFRAHLTLTKETAPLRFMLPNKPKNQMPKRDELVAVFKME